MLLDYEAMTKFMDIEQTEAIDGLNQPPLKYTIAKLYFNLLQAITEQDQFKFKQMCEGNLADEFIDQLENFNEDEKMDRMEILNATAADMEDNDKIDSLFNMRVVQIQTFVGAEINRKNNYQKGLALLNSKPMRNFR